MANPVWKGAVSFGLVTIPVNLYSAVRAAADIHFRQLHDADLAPVKNERVCSLDGAPVAWGDIVKGYEVSKDQFVVLDEDDFKAAEVHTRTSKVLEVESFVPAAEIDPRYYERPYFVTPGQHGEKAYALLRDAMSQTDTVGVGKITLYRKQHVAALRALGDALVLTTMRFADELVPLGEFNFPHGTDIRAQERKMAEQLIGNLAQSFDPAQYKDEYREALMAVIERKAKGQRITIEPEEEVRGTPVIDLMARLQESLAQGKPARGAARKRAAAAEEPAAESEPAAPSRSARKTTRARAANGTRSKRRKSA